MSSRQAPLARPPAPARPAEAERQNGNPAAGFAWRSDVPANDIQLSIERNTLTVRGEKRQETTTENESFYRSERSYGSFERFFALPAHVDTDSVKASLENGVLTIRFPRREEAKARPIEIEGIEA